MSEVVFIENYRGKDIFYSTSNEKFFADIDEGKEKNLIHLVRKDIDDYMKANTSFKPFRAFNCYRYGQEIKTVTGIRKDKGLQCEGNSQISSSDLSERYSVCNWFALNEEKAEGCLAAIAEKNKEIKALEDRIRHHEAAIKGFVDQMKSENLADFRRRILGETKEQ